MVEPAVSCGGRKQSSGLIKDEQVNSERVPVPLKHSSWSSRTTPRPVSDEDVLGSVACEVGSRGSDSANVSSAISSGMLPEDSVAEEDRGGCLPATALVSLGCLPELESGLLPSADGVAGDVSVDVLQQEDSSLQPASRSLFRQSSHLPHSQEGCMACVKERLSENDSFLVQDGRCLRAVHADRKSVV